MDATFPAFIDHPMAWRGSDIKGKDDIAFDLTRQQQAGLEELLGKFAKERLALGDIRLRHCRHPALDVPLARVFDEIQEGRGIVIIRGILGRAGKKAADAAAVARCGAQCAAGRARDPYLREPGRPQRHRPAAWPDAGGRGLPHAGRSGAPAGDGAIAQNPASSRPHWPMSEEKPHNAMFDGFPGRRSASRRAQASAGAAVTV
jgi:hypothetical protein